jgi:O-antigen ligase
VATKSNGGAIAFLSGLAVWGVLRAYSLRVRPLAIAGACALLIALGLLGWGLVSQGGVGASLWNDLRQKSFAERMTSSSESRMKIWSQLQESYARSPLGIGPGNSRVRTVSVEQRARPGVPKAKEAHSDYLGYAIERGPIALIGLLLLLGEAFRRAFIFLRNSVRGSAPPAAGAFAAAMIAGLVASSVHSLVIEKLHFRHFWAFLAILVVGTEVTRLAASRGARPAGTLLHNVDDEPVPIALGRLRESVQREMPGRAAASSSTT